MRGARPSSRAHWSQARSAKSQQIPAILSKHSPANSQTHGLDKCLLLHYSNCLWVSLHGILIDNWHNRVTPQSFSAWIIKNSREDTWPSPFSEIPPHNDYAHQHVLSRTVVPDIFGTRDRFCWKTIFPRNGAGRRGVGGWGGGEDGSGGNASDGGRWGAANEASLAHRPLTSCCVARFLTGHGPGVRDPWSRTSGLLITKNEN